MHSQAFRPDAPAAELITASPRSAKTLAAIARRANERRSSGTCAGATRQQGLVFGAGPKPSLSLWPATAH